VSGTAPALEVEVLTVGPLATNAYLVADTATRDAVAVDPGDEGDRLLARLRERAWSLREIWLTHAHFDHVGAVDALVSALGPLPVRLHPADRALYRAAGAAAAAWAGIALDGPHAPTLDLAHGERLRAGSVAATVRHVPGHAPGHVVFVLDGAAAVMAGDTLMKGGVGRWDLPGGDYATLIGAIRRELMSLPADTVVWPGHGPATTIREETANPFLG
jgi:hydroxyacylglutathione hydrolase